MEIDWMSGLSTAAIFLGIPMILGIFYAQWKWAKVCDENIRILVAQESGGGRYFNAPKAGNEVTIVNNKTGITRTWPINELATIDVPYPGVGFVPKFLQKSIRLAILNEGDWEPMLNRSSHQRKVASPDVIEYLLQIANKAPKLRTEIMSFLDEVSSGSTREMIADPAILGALKQNTIMQALAQVGDELTESIRGLRGQLSRLAGLNPMLIYIGVGAAVALGIATLIMMNQSGMTPDVVDKIDAIYRSLGIQP